MEVLSMNDWDSKHYKKHATVQQSVALRIIEGLKFSGNEQVLDIGCGDGKVTSKIAELIPDGQVIGMDVSVNMICEAQLTYAHIPNLSFVQKDVQSFTFDQKFDLVTSFFALHWVANHELVLGNIKAVLNKGGKIIFIMPVGGDKRIGKVFGREPWKSCIKHKPEQFGHISIDRYHQLLDQFCFTKEKVEIVELTHIFKTLQDLSNYFMTWLPYYTGLPQERCQQLAHELAETIAYDQGAKSDIALSSSMLYVCAHLD